MLETNTNHCPLKYRHQIDSSVLAKYSTSGSKAGQIGEPTQSHWIGFVETEGGEKEEEDVKEDLSDRGLQSLVLSPLSLRVPVTENEPFVSVEEALLDAVSLPVVEVDEGVVVVEAAPVRLVADQRRSDAYLPTQQHTGRRCYHQTLESDMNWHRLKERNGVR